MPDGQDWTLPTRNESPRNSKLPRHSADAGYRAWAVSVVSQVSDPALCPQIVLLSKPLIKMEIPDFTDSADRVLTRAGVPPPFPQGAERGAVCPLGMRGLQGLRSCF